MEEGLSIRWRIALIAGLCLFYGSSFLLPVIDMGIKWGNPADPILGWQAFAVALGAIILDNKSGWVGQIYCAAGWLPNLLFLFGIFAIGRQLWGAAAGCGLLGFLLTLIWGVDFEKGELVFKDYLPGYYVWLMSLGLMAMTGMSVIMQAGPKKANVDSD